MAMIAAVPAVEAAAAPAAEAAAGQLAGGAAAKQAGGQAAKKAGKKAAGAGAGRTPKQPAGGPAGGPPPAPQAANETLGTIPKAAKNAGRTASDAFKSATLKPPRRLNAHDVSGFAFGMVLYALALSAIRYGFPAGPKGWLSAKFINKVILSDTDQLDRPHFRRGTPPPDPRTWPIR